MCVYDIYIYIYYVWYMRVYMQLKIVHHDSPWLTMIPHQTRMFFFPVVSCCIHTVSIYIYIDIIFFYAGGKSPV